MKKWTIKIFLTVICIGCSSIVSAETYSAKAMPIIVSKISYGFNDAYRGIITYVAREGQIVHGPKFDAKGNIKEQGSLLIEMATGYRDSLILQAESELQLANENYNFTAIENARYKRLAQGKSVSIEDYQKAETLYLKAKQDVIKAKGNLFLQQQVKSMCKSYAEYDAIVQQVYLPYGLAAPEPNVLKLAQLNPMGISIKMDKATAMKITNSSKISVYPMNGTKPSGIIPYTLIFNDDGVTIRVLNHPFTPKGLEGISKVKCIPAIISNNNIYAFRKSFRKDDKGIFIWKAVDVKSLEPGKGIPDTFKVKKVYVTMENEMVRIGGFAYYQMIKPINDKINNGDIIVFEEPSNLKENEEVCAYQEKYLFMPGDNVKVDIQF
ncbi:MAG: hypothetical protein GY756_12185 [bacterium]|nr:hypothetical protein [bacterium]